MAQYTGSCHCGAVRYEVELEVDQLIACNCSICSRTGMLMAFAPAERFRLLQGEDAQTDYQFGSHSLHHPFCRTCGVRTYSYGSSGDQPTVCINARCLQGFDTKACTVNHYDGASL